MQTVLLDFMNIKKNTIQRYYGLKKKSILRYKILILLN
jgi:hypothetical protein